MPEGFFPAFSSRTTGRAAQVSAEDEGESHFQRAVRLRRSPDAFAKLSKPKRDHIIRMVNPNILPVQITTVLDAENAPFAVCRWVAWGRRLQDRLVRLEVVLFLKREARLDCPGTSVDGWAWPKDTVMTTGEELFYASKGCKRLVDAGVLAARNEIPRDGWFNAWNQVRDAVRTVLSSFDKRLFFEQACSQAKQKHRRSVRKRYRPSPREAAYLEALQTIKQGVLRGDIRLGEADELVVENESRKSAKKRTKKK